MNRTLLWGWSLGAALVAWGHAPLWAVLLWALGFALMRGSETARVAALTWPLGVAVLAGAARWPDVLAVTGTFARLALVGAALNFALDRLEEGSVWGLGLLTAVWLFAPTPLGLIGLLLCAALYGESRQRGRVGVRSRPALILLGGVALGLGLFALALPRAELPWQRSGAVSRTVQAPAPPIRSAQDRSPTEAPTGQPTARRLNFAPAQVPLSLRLIGALLPYLLPLFLAVFTLALIQLLRHRERWTKARRHWSDYVAAFALAGSLLMGLLAALVWQRSGGSGNALLSNPPGAGGAGGAALQNTAPGWAGAAAGAFGWVLLAGLALMFAALIVLAVQLLRAGPEKNLAVSGDEETITPPPPAEPAARVRAAYRAMLGALAGAGVARAPQETPGELAARAGGQFPGVEGDIARLTGLYQPVRYGARPDDEGAGEAEAALARVRAGLDTQQKETS